MSIRRDYKFTFPLQLPKSLFSLDHASRQSSSTARHFTQASSVDRLQVQTFAAAYGTCYAVLRHLCILGGAEENLPLFIKPSKVSGNVTYTRALPMPPTGPRISRIGAESYSPDRWKRALGIEDQAWVSMPALSWLPAGICFIAGAAAAPHAYAQVFPDEPPLSSRASAQF